MRFSNTLEVTHPQSPSYTLYCSVDKSRGRQAGQCDTWGMEGDVRKESSLFLLNTLTSLALLSIDVSGCMSIPFTHVFQAVYCLKFFFFFVFSFKMPWKSLGCRH